MITITSRLKKRAKGVPRGLQLVFHISFSFLTIMEVVHFGQLVNRDMAQIMITVINVIKYLHRRYYSEEESNQIQCQHGLLRDCC